MRVKLDENLPVALVDDLVALGHDVDSVPAENLAGASAGLVLAAAMDAGRILVTLDKGLGDPRRYPPERNAGVVLIRLRRRGLRTVRARILSSWHRIATHAGPGRLVVVTDTVTRVRR